jgi:threonine dehydratase
MTVGIADIRAAEAAVYRVAHPTPLLHSSALSKQFGCPLYVKAECLQRTGSFKARGAANRLAVLTPAERQRGVVAASAGNHAQGVALAAQALGISALVVMPANAALAKVQATRGYGAEVVLEGDGFADAAAKAQVIAAETGRVFISAYDDEAVIAGQGTLGLELAGQCPQARLVVVPVGGGGLIGGAALALKSALPDVCVFGVQAAGAPAAARSFRAGRRISVSPSPTLADGVAIPAPGRRTLPLIRRYVDEIVTVDEESIAQAITLLLERTKLVVEGAGALGLAALLTGAIRPAGRETVIVLSGGNIDINLLANVVQHGLLSAGRYLTLSVGLEDRPGTLAHVLDLMAAAGANVLEVNHVRQGIHIPVRGVEVRLLLETRDARHIEEIAASLRAEGYVERDAGPTERSFLPKSW